MNKCMFLVYIIASVQSVKVLYITIVVELIDLFINGLSQVHTRIDQYF